MDRNATSYMDMVRTVNQCVDDGYAFDAICQVIMKILHILIFWFLGTMCIVVQYLRLHAGAECVDQECLVCARFCTSGEEVVNQSACVGSMRKRLGGWSSR